MTTLNDKIYAKLVKIGKNEKSKNQHWQKFSKFKLIVFVISAFLVGMTETYNQFTDFQKVFKEFDNTNQQFQTFDSKRIEFYPHPLSYPNERYFASYGISNDYLRLKFNNTAGFILGNIDIPAQAILGCSQSSYGKNERTTLILLKNQNLGFSIVDFASLKDWCYTNHLPAFTSSEIRNWRDKKEPLPSGQVIADRLKSKENYDFTLTRACMGY